MLHLFEVLNAELWLIVEHFHNKMNFIVSEGHHSVCSIKVNYSKTTVNCVKRGISTSTWVKDLNAACQLFYVSYFYAVLIYMSDLWRHDDAEV